MSQDPYQIRYSHDFLEFRFESIGPNGLVEKIVRFDELDSENWFNLGFGDYFKEMSKVDDTIVTNNKDTDKVLISVGRAVQIFLEKRPGAIIVFRGSTETRTWLYQRKLLRYLAELEGRYKIQGLFQGKWVDFNGGKQFDAFSVSLR